MFGTSCGSHGLLAYPAMGMVLLWLITSSYLKVGATTRVAVPDDATSLLQLSTASTKEWSHSSAKWRKYSAKNSLAAVEKVVRMVMVENLGGNPEIEHGLTVQHGMHSAGTSRSDTQVLIVCFFVIGVVSFGWLAYWAMGAKYQADEESGWVSDKSTAGNCTPTKLALLSLSFAACSWGMNVVNKTLIHAFNAPCLVTGAQMCMTITGTLLLARDRISGSSDQVLKWSFIPLIFFGMLVSSFFTYKYLTLSMLMVVRNVGPIVTLPIESMVMPANMRPPITMQTILSLGMVLISTFIYCQRIETSISGLLMALLNMALAITDRVAQRRLLTTECKGLTTETCMLMNNAFGIVPTVILAFCLGEFQHAKAHDWFLSLNTVLLLLSGFIGTGICYFALAVQREVSATSFLVLQNVVRMAVVVVGVAVFLDPLQWPYQELGLFLSFAGAIWYGKSVAESTKDSHTEQDAAKASDEHETVKAAPIIVREESRAS
jgi:solute carrier family 35 protein